MSQMIQTHEARSHYGKSQVQSVSEGERVSSAEGRESVLAECSVAAQTSEHIRDKSATANVV